jgi:ABC-type Fe3+-hydroxamate transport system substrate-binding protein
VGAVERVRARRSARWRTVAAFAVAAASLLFLTGCGQRSEPTGATVEPYPVTIQQDGPDVVVDQQPQHVVALTQDSASLVSSVLGREVAAVQSVPSNADLVVTTSDGETTTGAKTYVAPDGSVEDVQRSLTELGLLLDRPIEARRLVEDIQTKRSEVQRRLKGVKPVTVFVDTGLFSTVSDQSLLGRLIEEAGGDNIAGPGPQSGPFDVTKLARLDPDVYFATSDSGTTLADLRRDPRTKHLKAVRTNRFAVLAARVVEPGGQIGTELVAIARYLHPDAFR